MKLPTRSKAFEAKPESSEREREKEPMLLGFRSRLRVPVFHFRCFFSPVLSPLLQCALKLCIYSGFHFAPLLYCIVQITLRFRWTCCCCCGWPFFCSFDHFVRFVAPLLLLLFVFAYLVHIEWICV